MQEPLVSIIVPVYNGQEFLLECANSILNQSYEKIEILLVNDGSTDGTGKLLAGLAGRDDRVRVLNIGNSGVSFARKTGLDASTGTYICFVDADDTLQPCYVAHFVNSLKPGVSVYCAETIPNEISATEWTRGLLKNEYSWFLHHKMYSKEVLATRDALNIPREINIGEDLIANIRCVAGRETRIAMIDNPGYAYRNNPASASRRRKYSLSYEEMFMTEVEKALGTESRQFADELWLFKLRIMKVLTEHNIQVPRDREWVRQLRENRPDRPAIGFGDRLLLNIPSHYAVLWALRLISAIKRVKKS